MFRFCSARSNTSESPLAVGIQYSPSSVLHNV